MANPKIYDIATLDAEIKRLKLKSRELEGRFNDSADVLKENYGRMAFNSFIGNNVKSIPLVGPVIYNLLEDPGVQEAIQAFSESLMKKGTSRLQKWLSALFDRK